MGIPNRKALSIFDQEVINALVIGAVKTIHSYSGISPTFTKCRAAINLEVVFQVAGFVNFEADSTPSQLAIAFDKSFALEVYKNMLGVEATEINDDVLDCISELTNIIYGSLKAPLVNLGHKFTMARPTTTMDINSQLKNKKSLEVPFRIGEKLSQFSLILSV